MVKCKKCGNETGNEWKFLCFNCYKEVKQKEKLQREKEKEELQKNCKHEEKTKTSYPTKSGCYLIHELICKSCGKILEHTSEEVTEVFMQKVFEHWGD